MVTFDLLMEYKSLRMSHLDLDICNLANIIRAATTQIIPDGDLLRMIRLSLKHDMSLITSQVRLRQPGEDISSFVGRLEDVLVEK
jgi:hypothetical protein